MERISFKGLTVETRPDGKKQHVFYSPGSENIKLELVRVKKDEKGNYEKIDDKPKLDWARRAVKDDYLKIWLPTTENKDYLLIDKPDVKLAYRFKDGNDIILDENKRIGLEINGKDEKFNLAWDPQRPDYKKARAIYHLMPDMIGPEYDKDGNPVDDQRNHFNIFGGKIEDISKRLDHIQELGATRILSTPVFLNGPPNSNGYWTKNAYQVDPVRGKLTDFRELQKDMFKRGMGFIADGAFVNESWEGIHIKDVMKYKDKSPFAEWFFLSEPIYNDPNAILMPQLLPDKNKEGAKHVGVKLINARYKFKYSDKEKSPEVVLNNDYKEDGRTPKIQIFDRRYVSLGKQNDSKIIEKTDETHKSNEVKGFDDSVQLVTLDTNAIALEKKLKDHLDKPLSVSEFIYKDTPWGRAFGFTSPNSGSYIDLWDGQNDIPKLRFFVTNTEKKHEFSETRVKQLEKASYQVQDNVVQVGQHWTSEVEKTLSEHAAKKLSEKLNGKEANAANIMQAIQDLAGKEIPKESADLIKKEEIKNLLKSKYSDKEKSYTGSYTMQVAPLPENITEGIMSYPLEAIEFPDDLCSLLSSPYIKKLATTKDQVGKSRYELLSDPNHDKMDHKEMDKLYKREFSEAVEEIIDGNETLKKKLARKEDGTFASEEGRELFRILSGDIVKFLVIKAIAKTDPEGTWVNSATPLEYDREKLVKNAFTHWQDIRKQNQMEGHKGEADSLIDAIKKGLSEISNSDKKDLGEYLANRIKGLDGKTIKVSKLILNKTESGLEWRIDAAKDAANLKAVIDEKQNTKAYGLKPEDKNTFAENWDEVIKFWSRFIGGIKEQNPKQYSIAESSNLYNLNYKGEPVQDSGYPVVVQGYAKTGQVVGNYKNAGEVVSKFIEQTGFTTESNYTYLFSFLPDLSLGKYEDKSNGYDYAVKKLMTGWGDLDGIEDGATPGFLRFAPVDSVLYSHVFTDNHDMKRSLHILSVDQDEYNSGLLNVTEKRENRWRGYDLGEKLLFTKKYEEKVQNLSPIIKEEVFDKAFTNFNDYAGLKDDNEKIKWTSEQWVKDWILTYRKDSLIDKKVLDKYLKYKKEVDDIKKESQKYAPAFIMADRLMESYEESIEKKNISPEVTNTIKKAINAVAMEAPEQFGRRAVHHNWRDVMIKAKELDSEINKKIPGDIDDRVYENFVKPGMARMQAIELYKQILPGSPTMYTGTETAETGLESDGKNMYLYNRNRVHFEWLKDSKKTYIADYYKDLKQKSSLRTGKLKNQLSPLVNGQTIMLKRTSNDNIIPLYRYNKDTDIIALLNTTGVNKRGGEYKVEPVVINSLDTTRDGEFGVPGGIAEDTIYINAFNQDDKYVIKDGNLKSLSGNGKITIDEPALLLYRQKKFNGQS